MSEAVVCLSTAGSLEEAEKIARGLVTEELAACVNIVPGVRSIYRWEGEIEHDEEWLMVIKSRKGLVSALLDRLKELHSYSLPELVVMDVVQGNPDYLAWISRSTRQG